MLLSSRWIIGVYKVWQPMACCYELCILQCMMLLGCLRERGKGRGNGTDAQTQLVVYHEDG